MYKDSIRNPAKHCLKSRGRENGDWNVMKGVNLFKVYTHGIITMKIPGIINE
jgi:hypothetical protein